MTRLDIDGKERGSHIEEQYVMKGKKKKTNGNENRATRHDLPTFASPSKISFPDNDKGSNEVHRF